MDAFVFLSFFLDAFKDVSVRKDVFVTVGVRACEGRCLRTVRSARDVIQIAHGVCCKAAISVKIRFHFSVCLPFRLIFIIN